MEILAVYPREPEIPCHAEMPPLGMLWVGGELLRAGHGVEFIDEQVDKRDPAVVAEDLKPAICLVGGTSHSRFASFDIASRVKEANPQTVVVYGGPHATFTADDTLQHIAAIDVVVRGEGEETCLGLADWAASSGSGADLREVNGISYRDDGRIVHNPARPPIRDLNALGAPARRLVPMERYHMRLDFIDAPATSIISARGCPVGCTFCSASAMFGRRYRAREPAMVVDELETLVTELGLRGIKIIDSTFTQSRRHVRAFCAEMVKRRISIPWECEIRIGTVDRSLLEEMRTAGCYCLAVGVESGSQRVLDDCIRKGFSLNEALETFEAARELGFLIKAFFTVGHPGEKYEEAWATNDFIRRHGAYIRLAAYHAGVKIYPGTYVAQYAAEEGLLPHNFRWSAPYVNYANSGFFRDVDMVPTLIQKGLGAKELRSLRLAFIRMKLSSPRFVIEKIRAIIRMKQLWKYFKIVGRGFAGRRH